jgi:hypothetical protein
MKKIYIDGVEIEFDQKSSWIKRLILSIKDVIVFNFKTLSPGWKIALLITILVSILNSLFKRDFSGIGGTIAPFVAALILLLPYIKILILSIYEGKIIIVTDSSALEKLKVLNLSDEDKDMGFKYIYDRGGGAGVVLSPGLNRKIFLHPEFDMPLKVVGKVREKNIIDSLASRRDIFSSYITTKFLKSLITKNPLINELKIGFCNSFWLNKDACEVYKSTYFYSLCTGDLALSKVYRDKGDIRHSLVENSLLTSLIAKDNRFEMRNLEDNRKPISLHGGVELIGVSKDFWLRIAVQGDHTQFSQGKKAPLGSGSMDWEDFNKSRSLKNLIKISAVREFLEEWGKNHRIKEDIIIEDIICLGFFRMPHRGGKPQFVVLCKFGNNNDQLRPDSSEVYVEEPENNDCLFQVRTIEELYSAVRKVLKNSDKRNSIPLLGALKCLQYAIKFDPELISKTLGYNQIKSPELGDVSCGDEAGLQDL